MIRFLAIFLIMMLVSAETRANPYPIQIQKGLILTTAIIDGREATIILDTGAPGLVLNASYFSDSSPMMNTCTGINGSFDCQTVDVSSWQWLGNSFKNTEAIVSDLSFLEHALRHRVDALVGLSVLQDYYIHIDYDQSAITLSRTPLLVSRRAFTKFQYADHLPVISCKVNGEKKLLALDTGAGLNFLFGHQERPSVVATSDNLIRVTGTENKTALHRIMPMKITVDASTGVLSEFVLHETPDGAYHHPGLDGLLGQNFLTRYNIIIHPGKQLILFSPRETLSEDLLASLP